MSLASASKRWKNAIRAKTKVCQGVPGFCGANFYNIFNDFYRPNPRLGHCLGICHNRECSFCWIFHSKGQRDGTFRVTFQVYDSRRFCTLEKQVVQAYCCFAALVESTSLAFNLPLNNSGGCCCCCCCRGV